MERFLVDIDDTAQDISSASSGIGPRETLIILNQLILGAGDNLSHRNQTTTQDSNASQQQLSRKNLLKIENYLLRLSEYYLNSSLWNLPITPNEIFSETSPISESSTISQSQRPLGLSSDARNHNTHTSGAIDLERISVVILIPY